MPDRGGTPYGDGRACRSEEVRAQVLRAAQEHGWKTLHFDCWARGGWAFLWKKLVAELEFEQVLTAAEHHGAAGLEGV
jgi:hypothetical protein